MCEVTDAGYAAMTRSVAALGAGLGVPVGFVLEGGYDLGALGRGVTTTMAAAAGDATPPEVELHPAAAELAERLRTRLEIGPGRGSQRGRHELGVGAGRLGRQSLGRLLGGAHVGVLAGEDDGVAGLQARVLARVEDPDVDALGGQPLGHALGRAVARGRVEDHGVGAPARRPGADGLRRRRGARAAARAGRRAAARARRRGGRRGLRAVLDVAPSRRAGHRRRRARACARRRGRRRRRCAARRRRGRRGQPGRELVRVVGAGRERGPGERRRGTGEHDGDGEDRQAAEPGPGAAAGVPADRRAALDAPLLSGLQRRSAARTGGMCRGGRRLGRGLGRRAHGVARRFAPQAAQ